MNNKQRVHVSMLLRPLHPSAKTSSMPVEEEENREPFTHVLDQDSATWTPVREKDPDFCAEVVEAEFCLLFASRHPKQS